MSTTVEAPAPANPAQIGRDSLQAQIDLAPQQFSAYQQFAPQYADLASGVNRQLLFGNFDAGQFEAAHPGFLAEFQRQQAAGELQGWTPAQFAAAYSGVGPNDPSLMQYMSGGMLSQYQQLAPSLSALQSQANTAQRTADIGDVANLGGQATAAFRAANPDLARATTGLESSINAAAGRAAPQLTFNGAAAPTMAPTAMAGFSAAQAGQLAPAALATTTDAQAAQAGLSAAAAQAASGGPLLGQLTRDASTSLGTFSPIQAALNQQGLDALRQGGDLSAQDLRNIQQDTRGAYAARGLFDSNQAIGAEILNTDAARRQRLLENQQRAAAIDAAGQQQVQANRGYAQGVQAQGQGLSQFNTGQANQVGLFNAGQANDTSRFNAGNLTNVSLANAAAANDTSKFNANSQNQFSLTRYAAENDLAKFNSGLGLQASLANAGAQNAANSQQYGTQANLNQYNAGLGYQTQLANAGLQMQAGQQNIQNQFGLTSVLGAQAADPYALVLGRSGVPGQAMGAVGQAQGQNTGVPAFDPFNTNIMNMYAGNQANQLAANTATANNRAGLYSAALMAVGSMLGCWTAREVFRGEGAKWVDFRRWMFGRAPESLLGWYLVHGRKAAEIVRGDSALRAQVRRFMEAKIFELESSTGALAPA